MRSHIHRHALVIGLFFCILATAVVSPALAGSIGLGGTTIILTGDAGADVIFVSSSGSNVGFVVTFPLTILTPVCIPSGGGATCALAGIDLVAVLAGAGDDVVEASGVGASLGLFLSGGAGDDVIIGGNGDDTLKGGAGDDVLIGGPGLNLLFGGAGDNILLSGLASSNGDGPPDPTLAPVPEPATLLLVGRALGACGARQRRRG